MVKKDGYELSCGHFSSGFVICDDCMTVAPTDGKKVVIK